jgi:hypothetical protein
MCVVLTFLLFLGCAIPSSSFTSASLGNLTGPEVAILDLVNGSSIYQLDKQLEAIGQKYPAYRSAGSVGANETAEFIFETFQGFGIQTWNESFDFQTWDLRKVPSLMVDMDGNASTVEDRVALESFQADHLSWPSLRNGSEGAVVVLPLPNTSSYSEIRYTPLDADSWKGINTTGKLVVVCREVRCNSDWERAYAAKLRAQPPAGVILTYWNDWLETLSVYSMGSCGARPLSAYGDYYWQLKIPVGTLNYSDGRALMMQAQASPTSALMRIDAVLGHGEHRNVVAKIEGSVEPTKMVLLTAHYDSVMTPGFCDNGAGTAALLHLAQVLAQAQEDGSYRPKFSLLFVAFTAEEFWTVGSMQYVHQHREEMEDIQAVVNLDCIGSDDLFISTTDPGPNFDLDEVAKQAAIDLGIPLQVGPGGSDQDSFRAPLEVGQYIQEFWEVDLDTSNVVPVASSILVISEPLLIQDYWSYEKAGWIHTSRDASIPEGIPGWVIPQKLQDGADLAGLTVVRISTSLSEDTRSSSILPYLIGIGAISIAIIATYLIFAKRKGAR